LPADITKINSQLEIINASVECGKIKGSVDGWGIIRLEGYIDKQNQLVKLIHTMMKIKGVTNVENKVRITPWPLCETYLHLEVFQPSNTKNLTASIVGHPDNTFNVGDTFVIDLKLPKTPGYLYAVYIQSSGDAVKFFWGKKYSSDQNITLGGPGYKISSPIGKEMILVITSPKPLFSNENTNSIKPDKKFLDELKATARESAPKDRKKISYTTLEVLTVQ
jgi:hypothetical protein